VVGCGWAGARHARAFRAVGAKLAWAVDVDSARVQSIGAEHVTSELDTALADPRLDAVSVCLPHALHADAVLQATQAKKHVLVEKPIATSLEEADRMLAAADAAGVVLMVAETVHFDPLLARAVDLVHQGVIGEPALVQISREAYLKTSFLRDRQWFLDAHLAGGGIMLSGGVHDFEILRMLLGDPTEVYAVRVRQRFSEMQGDDTSVATVRFPHGATAVLVESFLMKSLVTASGDEELTVRADGDLGSLRIDMRSCSLRVFSEHSAWASAAGSLVEHDLRVPESDPFEREVAHFLDCVRTGAEPLTSGRSQRRPLELALAAYTSMASGKPVEVAHT
jgi:UDP-N-acetylglucosamine 3-dehydrogenase